MATLAIYAVGVLLCLLAGTALAGPARPAGVLGRDRDHPAGPLGADRAALSRRVVRGEHDRHAGRRRHPGRRGSPSPWSCACALRPRGVGIGAALRPGATGLVVLGAGVLAGALLLAATIEQGFATTIGVTNNDAWGYATLVDWLQNDPMPADIGPSIADPLTLVPWTTTRLHFGFGFEHFAAMLATLFGRQGFEVVNAAAAVGLAAAVGGWAAPGRRPAARPAARERGARGRRRGEPGARHPVRRELHDPVRRALPLAVRHRGDRALHERARVAAPAGRGARRAARSSASTPPCRPGSCCRWPACCCWRPEAPIWASSPLRRLAGAGSRAAWAARPCWCGRRARGARAGRPRCRSSRGPGEPQPRSRASRSTRSAAFFSGRGLRRPVPRLRVRSSGSPPGPVGWSALAGLIVLAGAPSSRWRRAGAGRCSSRWRLIAIAGGVLLTTLAIVLRYRVRRRAPVPGLQGPDRGRCGLRRAGRARAAAPRGSPPRAGADAGAGLHGGDLDPERGPEPPVVGRRRRPGSARPTSRWAASSTTCPRARSCWPRGRRPTSAPSSSA